MDPSLVFEHDQLEVLGISIPVDVSGEVSKKPTGKWQPTKKAKKDSTKNPKNRKSTEDEDAEAKEGKTARSTSAMDLELLREVSVSKPFRGKYREVPKNWETVVDNLKWRTISVKTARRRFELLLKKFRTDEGISLKSSGTEEEYNEKMQLLTDIKEFIDSEEQASAEKATASEEAAESVRTAALEGFSKRSPESSSEDESIRKKRKTDLDLAVAFKEKNSQEFQLKSLELEFRKEKFEKLLDQQEKDRIQRDADRQLELRRIEALEKSNENQHILMMKLLEKLAK